VPDIVFAVPPSGGALPNLSFHETPSALESYQVTVELNNLDVTFQGRLEDLHRLFSEAKGMLDAFIFLSKSSQLVSGKDECPATCAMHAIHWGFSPTPPADRPYQEQARINTRAWSGR
jgi:hypothetical protein